MKTRSDLYADVAQVYLHLVEHDGPDVSAALRQIYATAGSLAAWRAALVIRVVKIEAQLNHYFPNLGSYADLFEYFPEAVGLLEQAIKSCLPTWRIQDVQVRLENGNPAQLIRPHVRLPLLVDEPSPLTG